MTQAYDLRPVGVFDSGLGGLTSVRELEKILPSEDIVYFGDTGRVPYGTRSAETIKKYSKDDLDFLLTKNVKAVLVACGTVSSIALEELCEISPVPVVGVVKPASRAATEAALSDGDGEYGHIAVLGTPATAKNGAYVREIKALCESAKVEPVGCPMFVPLVENGYTSPDSAVTRLIAIEYVSRLSSFRPRSLILGCTHYPLIRASVERACLEVLGYCPTIIDSGACAASAISEMLRKKSLLAPEDRNGKSRFYVSDETHNFSSSASAFLGREIGSVERIRI